MKRNLLLAAVFASVTVSAQTFEDRASFWVKPDKVENQNQAAYNRYISDNYYSMTTDNDSANRRLNKNAALDKNTPQSLTTAIGSGHSNFYLVFKSEDAVEKDLMNFTFTCYQHTLTTHNINYHDVQKVEEKRKTGAIVKYGFNFPNATGDKNYVSIIDERNDLTDVYEVIYVNDAFTELDHQQIQTYLSIKYGISLINSANYVDANGRQIWNHNLNQQYNNQITGLGRSDYFKLNKTNTINSVDKRLEITSNNFNNNEYLFVGSNNNNTHFSTVDDGELLQTSWLVQTNTSNLSTLKFNLGTELKTNGTYELVINQSAATFSTEGDVLKVPGKIDGNSLVFENVMFDQDGNGFDTFSIVYTTNAKTDTNKPEIVLNNDTKVQAYPNPTAINETVRVSYNFGTATNLKIHVFTIDGKLIGKKEVNNTENYVYDTKFSSSGVYLIVSTYNGQVSTNKIIVK